MGIRVLLPDSEQARSASWGELPVDLAYYDGRDLDPPVADPAEVLVVGPTSFPAAYALADSLPRLRMVVVLWAGVEDWAGRLRPSVLLANCRGAYGLVTAELATAGLLALLRGLPTMIDNARTGTWSPFQAESLWGQRVLIVGAGDVAGHVARQLTPFETTIDMVGRTARDGVHDIGDIHDLLPRANVVVVTTPLTDETRHLVDADFLAAMPDRAVLVNISRGAVVVNDALEAELRSGRLRAVLDVTDPEPLPADSALWSLSNVLVTPHVGGAVDARAPVAMRIAVEQVRQLVAGHVPDNVVKGI